MAKLDLTGQRFGRLVVLGEDPIRAKGWKVKWRCRCDCGLERSILTNSLTRGRTRSCGCYMRARATEANLTHGQSYRGGKQKPSRLYTTWVCMKGRCYNPTSQDFARYGARGIRVCRAWQTFPEFERWALANGFAPELSIDRINGDGDYGPENCRWTNAKVQARNRASNTMLTYRGKTACLAEHAEDAGISQKTVSNRIRSGWPIAKALGTPRLRLGPRSPR